jgi:hypothetical protein
MPGMPGHRPRPRSGRCDGERTLTRLLPARRHSHTYGWGADRMNAAPEGVDAANVTLARSGRLRSMVRSAHSFLHDGPSSSSAPGGHRLASTGRALVERLQLGDRDGGIGGASVPYPTAGQAQPDESYDREQPDGGCYPVALEELQAAELLPELAGDRFLFRGQGATGVVDPGSRTERTSGSASRSAV